MSETFPEQRSKIGRMVEYMLMHPDVTQEEMHAHLKCPKLSSSEMTATRKRITRIKQGLPALPSKIERRSGKVKEYRKAVKPYANKFFDDPAATGRPRAGAPARHMPQSITNKETALQIIGLVEKFSAAKVIVMVEAARELLEMRN